MRTPRGLTGVGTPQPQAAAIPTAPRNIPRAPFQPTPGITTQAEKGNTPMNPMSLQIVKWEGRYRNGQLQVYNLPANDGGGSYEVAGINDKYHPEQARKLAAMVRDGKSAEAEKLAAEYIDQYTAPVAKWTSNKGVEAFLRDTGFNRGLGGAAKVLQMALGVTADGKVGPKTLAALKDAEADPKGLLMKMRSAREAYELKVAGRRENFWKGLNARWDGALKVALSQA